MCICQGKYEKLQRNEIFLIFSLDVGDFEAHFFLKKKFLEKETYIICLRDHLF